MILWLTLFLLVILISFILAYQSMSDFQEIPAKSDEEYGLFLIRQSQKLTADVLESIHQDILKAGLIVSLERLFKGQKSALVIFGPKKILLKYKDILNLLELEDYTAVNKEHIFAWEVVVKKENMLDTDFPKLSQDEQVWWQMSLKANRKGFLSQMRAVVFTTDASRRNALADTLQNLASGYFAKIPKPFTTEQIFDFYKQRSLSYEATNPSLSAEQVLQLSLPT